MTIDSFCLDLIRNHYNALDIDPAFRIGDEGELTLLKGDVMEQVLEECYETADDGFLQFSEQFGSGKSDKAMEDVILQAWTFSQSHPWPDQWLDQCRQQMEKEAEGDLDSSSVSVTVVTNGEAPDPWEDYVPGAATVLSLAYDQPDLHRGSLTLYAAMVFLTVLLAVNVAFPKALFQLRYVSAVRDPEPTEFYLGMQKLSWVLLTVLLAVGYIIALTMIE